MKNLIYLGLILALLASCKQATETTSAAKEMVKEVVKKEYPMAISKIFDNHGSLEKWNSMKALTYEIVKPDGNEKQMVDLQNRHERIETPNAISGFTGTDYWVNQDTSYKGNVKFYTNLMFYFYAMPFVLADDGINYSPTEPLEFEGVSYPGMRISYGSSIGVSPEDEYFIHYDPKTNEMAWLGYTVTFHSGTKSDRISWIRYNDWKNFNGLKLPNTMTWFKSEDGKVTEARNTREFQNVQISETAFPAGTFDMPSDGRKVG